MWNIASNKCQRVWFNDSHSFANKNANNENGETETIEFSRMMEVIQN